MKTLFLSIFLVCLMGNLHSQVIPLDPATVTFQKVKTSSNLGNVTIEVREDYANHFSKDPLKFIEEHFSLESLDLSDYEEVEVKFKSSKGFLLATYDANGELKDTFQKFRDIAIPRAVWSKIYNDNIGWSMAGNVYTASGSRNKLENQKYKVKLVNGKEVKRVKFISGDTRDGRVVSN